MKKKNQTIIKFMAIFTIALVLSLTINTSIMFSGTNENESVVSDIQTVQAAEQTGCCIETKSGRTCVNDTTASECLPNKFRTYAGNIKDCSIVAPEDCSPQTCIPKELSEPCLRSKTAAECIALDGTPVPDEMDSIPACTKGCCIINKGEVADVMQNRTCQYKLNLTGYDETKMQFLPDVISQTECKELGAPTDIVCCVLGGGSCKYGFREECTTLNGRAVPLQGGQYCRDVRDCAITKHSKKDCGKRTGTEFDIYWYDSQGNQEELFEGCNYQEAFCRINQMTRQPECVTTTCSLPSNITHQKMTASPPKVTDARLFTYTLLSGTSQCYNFYTHYGDDSMYGKSTGLQNEILHCALGKVEIQGLGADRNWLCQEGYGPDTPDIPSTIHGFEVNNSWQDCTNCGKGGILPIVGTLLGPFPPLGGLASRLFVKTCSKNECEGLGDCTFYNKFPGGSADIGIIRPIVVCYPTYPPGTNVIGNNASNNCKKCGGPNMDLWNVCKERECEALGDCQFTSFGAVEILLIPLMILATYSIGRLQWMPVDCLIDAAIEAAKSGPAAPVTFGPAYAYCFTKKRPANFFFKVVSFPLTIIQMIQANPVIGILLGIGAAASITGVVKALGINSGG